MRSMYICVIRGHAKFCRTCLAAKSPSRRFFATLIHMAERSNQLREVRLGEIGERVA